MKNPIRFIALLFLFITLSCSSADKKIIVIDVSHGGADSGARVDEFSEKEIALEIAGRILELNTHSDIEIFLTRDSDKFVTLQERTAFIDSIKPELVVSIHTGFSKNEDMSGAAIFVSDETAEKEKSLALAMQLKNVFEGRNTKIKNANFFLLNNVSSPIVLLEAGYLSNESDRNLLTTREGQSEIAGLILQAIQY